MNFFKISESLTKSINMELQKSGSDLDKSLIQSIIDNSVKLIQYQAEILQKSQMLTKSQLSQPLSKTAINEKSNKSQKNENASDRISSSASESSTQNKIGVSNSSSTSSKSSSSSSPLSLKSESPKKQKNLTLSTKPLENSCPPPTKPVSAFEKSGNRFSQQLNNQQKQSFGNKQIDMPSQKFGLMKEKSGDTYRQQKHARKTGTFTYGKIDTAPRPSIFDEE